MSQRTDLYASIDRIRRLPTQIERLVADLTAEQLTTPYLVDEWTVAQNVHHLADSHMNSYIRCKLILTEDEPQLKPYDQESWASLPDASTADLSTSLPLLTALHARWVIFWRSMEPEEWSRTGFHPENGHVRLDTILLSYADHGEAHIDQISRTLAAQYVARPDTAEEFFANLTREWDALFNFLRRHEHVLDLPLEEGWSAKDHVAHITAWETFLLRHHLGGAEAASALELTPEQYADFSIDEINAALHARSRDKTLAGVLADAETTHRALMDALAAMPFDALLDPRYDDDETDSPLLDWVIGNTYDHYLEHGLYLRTHLPV